MTHKKATCKKRGKGGGGGGGGGEKGILALANEFLFSFLFFFCCLNEMIIVRTVFNSGAEPSLNSINFLLLVLTNSIPLVVAFLPRIKSSEMWHGKNNFKKLVQHSGLAGRHTAGDAYPCSTYKL